MTDKVPTIDLGDALTGHTAARSVAAREIDLACRTSGFFIIVGHGVPDDLLDAVIEHSREFFHLPRSEKDVVAPPGSEHFRGFLGRHSRGGDAPRPLRILQCKPLRRSRRP